MNAHWYEYTIMKINEICESYMVVAFTRTGTTWTTQVNCIPRVVVKIYGTSLENTRTI